MEATRLINTETGIEAIVEAVNDKRGAFKLTLRDTDADKAYGWVWHNDREVLVKQAQRAVA